MKTLNYISICLILLLSWSLEAQNTSYGREQKQQEQLRNKYGQQLEHATAEVGRSVMKIVAPQSGRDLSTEALIYEGITTSSVDGYIRCNVRIVFSARNWPSAYGRAEVIGMIDLYPSYRSVDKEKVNFFSTEYNDHFTRVCNTATMKKLEAGILVEY